MARQVIRNTWLRRALQQAGAPMDPTLRYRTLKRTSERYYPAHLPANEYILRAVVTYAFSNGHTVDFMQAFLVRDNAIAECLHFMVMPQPHKT